LARKIEERVRDVDEKLDTIIKRLDTIEAAVAASQQTSQLSGVLSDLRSGIALYSEPLKAIQRLYDARRFLKVRAVEKDEISRLIVQSLAMRGELNISQIERAVRVQRGKASRRIIRNRLKALQRDRVVEPASGSEHKYKLVE
jgi:hypothetical protein